MYELQDASFKQDAENICDWATGNQLGVVPNSNDVQLSSSFSPVYLSYRLFVLDIMGAILPYHVQKGCDEAELVCRCFGVYKQELIGLLTDAGANQYTAADLGAATRAGVGCGSCHYDLENLLELFGHKEKSTFNKSWKAMGDQELGVECNDILKAWSGAKVVGLRPGGVLIKAEISVRDEIKEAIDKKLGLGLVISFR